MAEANHFHNGYKPLSFREAIDVLSKRGELRQSGDWWRVWQQEHQRQFTVAQSTGYNVLGDIYDALQTNQANGLTFEQFKRELTPILQSKGWWGRTADGVQLGSNRRLQTIYDVNMRVSAARGQWQNIVERKAEAPFLVYTAIMDGRTRPAHRLLNGICRHVDDPFWDSYYPPCGWRCRCHVVQMDAETAREFGYRILETPHEFEYDMVKNPRTGAVENIPRGIDVGWNYHVGRDSFDLPPPIRPDRPPRFGGGGTGGAAPVAPVVAALVKTPYPSQPISRELFSKWAGDAIKNHPRGEAKLVGRVKPEWISALEANGITLDTSDIFIRDQDVSHTFRKSKTGLLSKKLYLQLPDLLSRPDLVFLDKSHAEPALILLFKENNDRYNKFVLRLNYKTKINGSKTTAQVVGTGKSILLIDFLVNSKHYKLIEGKY
ncbi:MAG: phage minor head protein [Alphaproteobacteria bacterium]|nr:phage minor head protein [Alphaproteobacteria bacterium]